MYLIIHSTHKEENIAKRRAELWAEHDKKVGKMLVKQMH